MLDPGYLDIRSSLDTPITRTVPVGALNVDLNASGLVVGVERLDGPVQLDDVVAVLRAMPFAE